MQFTAPLGIFGGTFDPIHNGHIFPVLEAAEKADIQKVALMPCYIPSHKDPASASSEDRLKMVELICDDFPLFYPDTRDIKRGKPTFSIDSLTEIRKAKPTTPLCFFIGTDSLQNLFTWHEWPTLFSLCHFVVCYRKAGSVEDIIGNSVPQQLEALLNERQTFNPKDLHNSLAGLIYLANTQALTVSSSEIRQQLANNQPNEAIMPTKILDYIHQHKLYRPSNDFC
jgi:nicotinate-nucleotide adenylyltransferase